MGLDEEEEEKVMDSGIMEVAEICNQNHFSGNHLNPLLLPLNESFFRSCNSKASLSGSLPCRAEESARLHPQPGQVPAATHSVCLSQCICMQVG